MQTMISPRKKQPLPPVALDAKREFGQCRTCPSCGSIRSANFLESSQWKIGDTQFRIASCNDCGLRFTDPLPSESDFKRLYDASYVVFRSHLEKPSGFFGIEKLMRTLRHWLNKKKLNYLGKKTPGSLLDVGCGSGDFLEAAKSEGWQISAVDYSEEACNMAAKKGAIVRRGDLTQADFPEQSFDAISLWHVLEHVPDPNAVLTELRRILRDDGVLAIEVPNTSSLGFRLLRKHWMPLEVPRHLQHFTPPTLEALLARHAFEPVQRIDFHFADFILCAYGFLDVLKIRDKLGIESISTDFLDATLPRKIAFVGLLLPLCVLSLGIVTIGALFGRNGELLTLVCRKRSG